MFLAVRKNYNDLMLLIYAVEFEDKKAVFLDKKCWAHCLIIVVEQ